MLLVDVHEMVSDGSGDGGGGGGSNVGRLLR